MKTPRNNRSKVVCNNNPIALAFREYANELDAKHNRYERIVKLSRDITIESKRIIFLLHTINSVKEKVNVLNEAQQRLQKLIDGNFRAVANELREQDSYQYRNAYSPGLQEFIEAYTFFEYLRSEDKLDNGNPMSDWHALQAMMQYEEPKHDTEKEINQENKVLETEASNFQLVVDPTEYILGVSDVTGELMRRCINSLGSGETEICLVTCKVLQKFYTGYTRLNCSRIKDMWRKITVMRQSVLKAENVCYNIKVRGGEAAKWGAIFDD